MHFRHRQAFCWNVTVLRQGNGELAEFIKQLQNIDNLEFFGLSAIVQSRPFTSFHCLVMGSLERNAESLRFLP
jgi:hypothetical protein